MMKTKPRAVLLLIAITLSACGGPESEDVAVSEVSDPTRSAPTAVDVPVLEGETRLANLQRLTHGGSNSEAYFSSDGQRLIFQATRAGESECDQIYVMDVDGANLRRVSTGEGRTTCGYFFPGADRILFSSTHHISPACPPPVDRSRGYVWPLHDYDIFTSRANGSDLRQLTRGPGYEAEATISRDGNRIIFTALRDGDLDLYAMDADGGNEVRLTDEVGYDGGAFFSADGSRIVYRAHHPTDIAEIEEYRALLAQGLVRPSRMDLFVMDADGSNKQRMTNNGAANFAPFFHPDGRRIIFSSNLHDPSGRSFNLYLLDLTSGAIERLTHNSGFDSFPMFNHDGSKLVFASDRGASAPGEFNIFVSDWRD